MSPEELTRSLDAEVGDDAAGRLVECFVDVASDLLANPQAEETADPGVRMLYRPADGAESGAVRSAAEPDRVDPHP